MFLKTPVFKLNRLIRTISNWYLVFLDKLHLLKEVHYSTYSGTRIITRGGTTDINEVVTVLSGTEYPAKYFSNLKPDSVVFDLGANIGSFTLFLTKECGVQVKTYSFEPHSQNYDYLVRNIAINGISGNIAINAAVGKYDGVVNLEQPAGLDSVRITHGEFTGLSTTCTKLSTYCTKYNIKKIALMKIDIEGGEYAVLDADYEFVVNHVEKILIEYHNLDHKHNVDYITHKFQPYYEIEKIHDFVDMSILYLQRKLTNAPSI